jgi:hypothetical protein
MKKFLKFLKKNKKKPTLLVGFSMFIIPYFNI